MTAGDHSRSWTAARIVLDEDTLATVDRLLAAAAPVGDVLL
jgi:hypothetical protein